MKNSILITGAVVVGGLFILASTTFAGYGQSSISGTGRGMIGQNYARNNSGTVSSNYSTYGVNVVRKVTNISNGVEVTMTTTDTTTLEHMKTMFTQNSSKAPQNSLIKIERTALADGTKLTITSTDAATIKSIQERANLAKTGAFGNGGQGRGMMGGNGQGMGRGNGGNRAGGCAMFQ